MTRCSKSLAETLVFDPQKDLFENTRSMLSALQNAGITELMPAHIYKQFPEDYDFQGSTWRNYFGELTTKSSERGWVTINSLENPMPPVSVSSTVSSVSPLVVANSTGVVWTPTQTAVDHEIYAEDAGLMRIALMDNRCFGEYVAKGKCRTCPLAGSCQVASFSKIAQFAAALDAETEKALNPAPPVKEEPQPEIKAETKKEEPKKPAFKEGWVQIKTPITSVCSGCGDKIPQNTDCISIRGKGNFHMGCAE